MNNTCPECWEKKDEAVNISDMNINDHYICNACGNSRITRNPFEIIESDKGYHNALVGKILQLMGTETKHISPIDYLYMTKIVQELVRR